MKKIYFLFSFFLLLNHLTFPQDGNFSTVITSVFVKGKSITPSRWNSLEITSNDSITIFFNTDYKKASESSVLFKKILDGVSADSYAERQTDKYVLLSKLKTGSHVFQVNAYTTKGWQSAPAILKFFVRYVPVKWNVKPLTKADTAYNSQSVNPNSNFNMLTYILFGVILLLVLIIVYLLVKRKGEQKESPSNGSWFEVEDYKYSYEKLKKEVKGLKDINDFLKIQLKELKAYVNDLEDANVQLVKQKEKLQDGKRQLEDLQKQKDDLFAVAVHDIKNPVSIIKGLIELLTDYDLNAKEQQQVMQSLTETSDRIVNLAQKMSLVCAKSKPEPEIELEPASIKDIIDSVCKRNMAYANNKGVKLINNTSPNLPLLNIDKSKMDEVMDNLINNAIKYGPQGTMVQVKSFFNNTTVTVEVTDTGVGFSDEDMFLVFQKGAMLSSQPTGGETRSGLGLWIVKKIIEEHEGRINLESKKGVGSRFIVELPIKQK